jgi:hypothetical protein
MVGPDMGGHPIHDFVEARDRALRVLYDEVIRPKVFARLRRSRGGKRRS